jgi:hypothetical protein
MNTGPLDLTPVANRLREIGWPSSADYPGPENAEFRLMCVVALRHLLDGYLLIVRDTDKGPDIETRKVKG